MVVISWGMWLIISGNKYTFWTAPKVSTPKEYSGGGKRSVLPQSHSHTPINEAGDHSYNVCFILQLVTQYLVQQSFVFWYNHHGRARRDMRAGDRLRSFPDYFFDCGGRHNGRMEAGISTTNTAWLIMMWPISTIGSWPAIWFSFILPITCLALILLMFRIYLGLTVCFMQAQSVMPT